MIPTYMFLYQFCGSFVNVFYILFYVKYVVSTCLNYSLTVYHFNEHNIPDFLCNKYCCDIGSSITTHFQVFGQILIHIFSVWSGHTPICFLQYFVSSTCSWNILGLYELKWKCYCTSALLYQGKKPLCPCTCIWFLVKIKYLLLKFPFFKL